MSTHAGCGPSLAAAAAGKKKKKHASQQAAGHRAGMLPQTQRVAPSWARRNLSPKPKPAGEPEPKQLQERRGPAVLGPAGAAEAEAGAAGARWGCLKEIYNHFLSVVW